MGDPRRRLLPHPEVPRRAARRCPSRCTGSSGRRTRRGSSGFALLVVLYYLDADTYLIDRSVADLSEGSAVAISLGLLAVAWLVYDGLCRLLGGRELLLALAVVAFLAAAGLRRRASCSAPGRCRSSSARCSARSWSRNVLFVIIPAHWAARPREGGGPRARPGARAPRQAALGAQQLPDAAGRARDARRPLPVPRTRTRTRWLVLLVADAARRVGAALLQPAPPRPERLGDPGDGRDRASPCSRSRSGPDDGGARARPRRRSSSRASQTIVEQRCAPCHSGVRRRRRRGRRPRHAGADRARRPTRSRSRPSHARDAARQRDRHDRRGARTARPGSALGYRSQPMLEIDVGGLPLRRAARGGRGAATRSRRSGGCSRSRRRSSTAAGAASRTGSPSATASSASGRRTRPATRARASSCSTRAASARRSCSSRTATARSRARRARSPATTSPRSSRAHEHLRELGRRTLWEGAQPITFTER